MALVVTILAAQAALVSAQDWRAAYPTVTFGVCEVEKGVADRARHIVDYLSEQTGVKVVLRTGPDYASMIDQIVGGGLQFLSCGPLPYATAYDRMGGKLEPLALQETKENLRGYYIVMVVKGRSSYGTLDDLRGKVLACPDPNSTSTFALPPAYMDPDRPFFGGIKVAGSHGNGIIGVVRGTYDCAVTWSYSEGSNAMTGMIQKGEIAQGDVRVIWRSSVVPNHCVCAPTSLPSEMRLAFRKALLDFAEWDPARFAQHAPDPARYVPAVQEDYRATMDIRANQKNASRLIR